MIPLATMSLIKPRFFRSIPSTGHQSGAGGSWLHRAGALLLILAGVVALAVRVGPLADSDEPNDYRQDRLAARAALDDLDPYAARDIGYLHRAPERFRPPPLANPHPPIAIVSMMPLAGASELAGLRVIMVTDALAIIVAMALFLMAAGVQRRWAMPHR